MTLLKEMFYTKLNVLRWSFAGTNSFSLYLPSQPEITLNGAFSLKEIYFESDVQDIVSTARLYGIWSHSHGQLFNPNVVIVSC